MSLEPLFTALSDVFAGPLEIETHARGALLAAAPNASHNAKATPLPQPFLDVMKASDAHPVCALIAETPLPWAPPQTSDDPTYMAHSMPKAHVELLGPDGLVHSSDVRLGLYGILPQAEYGLRTHPAEEVFIMLAGQAYWMRGAGAYELHRSGERSHHPTMLPHATKTGALAFMSVYIWHGDVSTDGYVYEGLPEG